MEEVDKKDEIKNTEKSINKDNIELSSVSDAVYQNILDSQDFENRLSNPHMVNPTGKIEVTLTLSGSSKPIKFEVDGDKSSFASNLKTELDNQIKERNLNGNQDIKYLSADFQMKPEDASGWVGGYRSIIG